MMRRLGRVLSWPFRMLGRAASRVIDFLADMLEAAVGG